MANSSVKKGKRMPISTTAKQKQSRAAQRLEHLRQKNACTVHKTYGNPEEIRREGLAVFEALRPARERANKTIPE